MVKVTILGASGKMGKANIEVFNNDDDVKIVGAVEREGSPYIDHDAGAVAGVGEIGVKIVSKLEDVIADTDVVVDFTSTQSTLKNLETVKNYGKSIVIGTTGFTFEEREKIKETSKTIAIVFSPNMSIGINTLFYLVRKAVELLGNNFETEIVEIHHDLKKDAPSGTALEFGRVIAEAKGLNFDNVALYGREGQVGKRKRDEIGILAVRVGDVVGEHTIIFGAPGERVEFVHKASSRKTFASGALRAVKFVAKKSSGLYTMEDVLGISGN